MRTAPDGSVTIGFERGRDTSCCHPRCVVHADAVMPCPFADLAAVLEAAPSLPDEVSPESWRPDR